MGKSRSRTQPHSSRKAFLVVIPIVLILVVSASLFIPPLFGSQKRTAGFTTQPFGTDVATGQTVALAPPTFTPLSVASPTTVLSSLTLNIAFTSNGNYQSVLLQATLAATRQSDNRPLGQNSSGLVFFPALTSKALFFSLKVPVPQGSDTIRFRLSGWDLGINPASVYDSFSKSVGSYTFLNGILQSGSSTTGVTKSNTTLGCGTTCTNTISTTLLSSSTSTTATTTLATSSTSTAVFSSSSSTTQTTTFATQGGIVSTTCPAGTALSGGGCVSISSLTTPPPSQSIPVSVQVIAVEDYISGQVVLTSAQGASVSARLVQPSGVTSNGVLVPSVVSLTTDSNGYARWTVTQASNYVTSGSYYTGYDANGAGGHVACCESISSYPIYDINVNGVDFGYVAVSPTATSVSTQVILSKTVAYQNYLDQQEFRQCFREARLLGGDTSQC